MKPTVYLIIALGLANAVRAQDDIPLLLPEEREAVDSQADEFNEAIKPAIAAAAKSTVRVWSGSRRLAYGTVVGDGSKVLTKWSEVARARLSARVPPPSADRVEGSERSILRREVEKKTRHLAIRKLFSRIPNLLPRLAPCLLMSPLSVAQYLSVELAPYDLVVFDEASQIKVPQAIGAMGRGKAVIVVGDSKQMPPTRIMQVDAAPVLGEVMADRLADDGGLLGYFLGHEVFVPALVDPRRVGLDLAQGATPSRVFDLRDVAANAGGILVGLLLSRFVFVGWCQRVEQLFISR